MTGNAWMFYLSLGAFVVLCIGYGSFRVWIAVRKRKIKKEISESQVRNI